MVGGVVVGGTMVLVAVGGWGGRLAEMVVGRDSVVVEPESRDMEVVWVGVLPCMYFVCVWGSVEVKSARETVGEEVISGVAVCVRVAVQLRTR